MKNVSSVSHVARRYAAQAIIHIQTSKSCIQEIARLNRALNIVWKTLLDVNYRLFTALYVIILTLDSAISIPLIRVITNESQKLTHPAWSAVFFFLYFFVVGAITVTAAEYFALKFSPRHRALLMDLRLLFNKGKRRAELEFELATEINRKYRIAIVLTMMLVLGLLGLCAYRVYIVNKYVWAPQLSDLVQLIPVLLALLLVFLGRYKGILLKRVEWSVQRRRQIKKYHQARTDADALVEVVIDQLQADETDWNNPNLPSEITHCIVYYRDKKPFELLEADPVSDSPRTAAM